MKKQHAIRPQTYKQWLKVLGYDVDDDGHTEDELILMWEQYLEDFCEATKC